MEKKKKKFALNCLKFTPFSFYSFRRNRGAMSGRALGNGSWDLFGDVDGISLGTSVGPLWGHRWDLGVEAKYLGVGGNEIEITEHA